MLLKTEQTQCRHCGQPTVAGTTYCCPGCEAVHTFISENKIEGYFTSRNKPSTGTKTRLGHTNFAYCDDPEFIRLYSPDGRTIHYYIEGLHCASCIWILEKLPEYCPDVDFARLNMAESTLTVQRQPDGRYSNIATVLEKIGYSPHPVLAGAAADELRRSEERRHLIRLGVAGACSGNIMLVAIANYAGATGTFADLFTWLSTVFAVPVLTYCAWPLYTRVWHDIKNRRLSLDVPIVLALVAGTILSSISLFRGEGHVYFDSLSVLVFLLMTSRYLLRRSQNKGLDTSSRSDLAFLATVHRKTANGIESVSSLALRPSDTIIAKAGLIMPADGILTLGKLWVDRSVVTGESNPVALNPGDPIEAGSSVVNGEAEVQLTATTKNTRISRLISQSEAAARNKPEFIRHADRVGRWFTVVVLSTAAVVVGYFALMGQMAVGVERALALIIVSCPCVFGMAIPLAYSLALKRAAKKGVIIRDGKALENILRVKNVFFDKTGTLTKGKMCVTRSMSKEIGNDQLNLRIALTLEMNSDHPVAQAFREYLTAQGLKPLQDAQLAQDLPGGGRRMVRSDGIYELRPLDHSLSRTDRVTGEYGLYRDGQWLRIFTIEDELRTDARPAVETLQGEGKTVHILSGDSRTTVRTCADKVGVPLENVYSKRDPEQKARCLLNAQEAMMVGDGVNDAGALSLASVGVALRGSIELSLRSAQVYLLKSDLRLIPWLFSLARRVRVTILSTLFASAAFNVVASTLAVLGYMSPLLAAILMPLSSFTVLGITLWSLNERGLA